MKLSEELKIKRAEKVARMQAILDARKENGTLRAATTEETTEYDNLKADVARMDTDITEAEGLEARGTEQPQKRSFHIGGKADKTYNLGKAVREFSTFQGDVSRMTGLEKETNDEMKRGIESSGLLVPYSALSRASNTTTNADSVDVAISPSLSILGYEPLYQSMGLTILPGLTGSLKIGRKDADIADEYEEEEEIDQTGNKASFKLMTPKRYGITDIFSNELMAQENPQVHAAYLQDMLKGGDRKLTRSVYAIALAAAAAQEVATGALTDPGMLAIMAAVAEGGAFAMTRSTFFAGMPVPVDAGSGKFLLNFAGDDNGIGNTHRGTKAYYSDLFQDGAAKKYLVYGKWSEIWLGFWGAFEVLYNPYTYQKKGQTELTVNRLACPISRNDKAFSRSVDLDSAT